jgi:hypothetical protein
MEPSPSWETGSCSATHRFTQHFMEPKVRCPVHKSLPLVPIMIHMNPAHTSPSYFPKIHFKIILPPTPRSSYWFSPQIPVCIPSLPMRAICLAYFILLDLMLIMNFSSNFFTLLWSKYSPQHHVLKYHRFMGSQTPHSFLQLLHLERGSF